MVLVLSVTLPICGAIFLPILIPSIWRLRHGAVLSNGGVTVKLRGAWTGYGIPNGVQLSKSSWEANPFSPLAIRDSVLFEKAFKTCVDAEKQNSFLSGAIRDRKNSDVSDVRVTRLAAGENQFNCVRSVSTSQKAQVILECIATEGNSGLYFVGHEADIEDGLAIVGSADIALRCTRK